MALVSREFFAAQALLVLQVEGDKRRPRASLTVGIGVSLVKFSVEVIVRAHVAKHQVEVLLLLEHKALAGHGKFALGQTLRRLIR